MAVWDFQLLLFVFVVKKVCVNMAAVTGKKYTMAEVKEHSSPTDVWTVIHDKVYDVTKFLNEVSLLDLYFFFANNNKTCAQHPGGDEVLIEAGGKNSTRDFDDVDHSAAAM